MSVELLEVSLLGFYSFCLTMSMMRFTLSGGVLFVRRWCRLSPAPFVSVGEHRMCARLVKDLMTLSLEDEGAQEL